MTYTPEELDDARVAEALRLTQGHAQPAVYIAARLAREGWQPPPKVDVDTLAARAWFATCGVDGPERVLAGRCDMWGSIVGFRAGLAHARASAPNADDVAELVALARMAAEKSGGGYADRLRKALAKFEHTRALPDSGGTHG